MHLLNLPNELLLLVAESLSQQDLNSLLRVNRHLSLLLKQSLSRLATQGLCNKTYNGQLSSHHSKLLRAALRGYEPLVRLMLETGRLDINYHNTHLVSPDIRHKTALHFAAMRGHEPVVRLLLDMGADVNLPDTEHGRTPLLSAAKNTHETVVRLLLGRGADVTARDSFRRTALILAIQYPYYPKFPWSSRCAVAVSLLLLQHGVEINAWDCAGRTALYYAIESGSREVVELLLERGACTDTLPGVVKIHTEWFDNRYKNAGITLLLQEKGIISAPEGWLQKLRRRFGRVYQQKSRPMV